MLGLALAALVGAQAIAPSSAVVPHIRQDLVVDLAPRGILRADIAAGRGLTSQEISAPATATLVSNLLNEHHLTLAAQSSLVLVAAPRRVATVGISVLAAAPEDQAGR